MANKPWAVLNEEQRDALDDIDETLEEAQDEAVGADNMTQREAVEKARKKLKEFRKAVKNI